MNAPAAQVLRAARRALPGTRSVRARMLALVLAPLLFGVPVLLGIVWVWGTHGYNQLLVNKVSADLLTARQYFERVQEGVAGALAGFAASHRLARELQREREDEAALNSLLTRAAELQGLDYLVLLDGNGRFRAGSVTLPPAFAERAGWPAVRDALNGRGYQALAVFSPEHLEALSPALRERAALPLVPTPNAVPDARQREERGLMIQATAPIFNEQGELHAVLEGGVMLNRNLSIVDRLNAVVYQDTSLPLDSQGTATLFLGDTRVATNVRMFGEGGRALGTRVSAAVREKVLERGETWLGSAFVVNAPYISGYSPLHGGDGERIGMLYVGFMQEPLQRELYRTLGGLFLLFLVVSALGTLGAVRWARSIFRPIERITSVMQRIEDGEETARMGPVGRDDELGQLAHAFDRLLDMLAARRAELQSWADGLDTMVAARTAELEAANATLRRAHQQLVMNEKLTAIGELTAGVAHEINNPVAVIQGNLELLREVLGTDAEPVHEEIRAIDAQVQRIHGIVAKLLQFARPGDFAGYTDKVDVNVLINDCLVFARHNLSRARVEVRTELSARSTVEINRGELQQVLINLIVNAMQAMPEGGALHLRTAGTELEQGVRGVRIEVEDTGQGIAPVLLDRIFDPFFTTKKRDGTGLGLSISYAIVTRYGGHIAVESTPGRGACFSVVLRCRPVYSEDPGAPDFARRFFDRESG